MADEDPSYGGMGSADAISAAAAAISTMRQDMAAIERSSKGIARNMSRVSRVQRATSGSGGGNTGSSTPVSDGEGLGLADITQAAGGAKRMLIGGATVVGGVAGIVGGAGAIPGAMAVAGFSDLRVGAQRGLDYEQARFQYQFGTGDFSTFRGSLEAATNEINVQDESKFMGSYAELSGFMGLPQPEIMEQFGTLSVMAGVDQSLIPAAAAGLYSPQAFYGGLAGGVQTRTATGEPATPEQIVNQLYQRLGLNRMSSAEAQEQINRGLLSGALRKDISALTGGDPNAMRLIIRGLQARAGGAESLSEEDLKESGTYGTAETAGMETLLGIEESKVTQTGEYVNDVTSSIATVGGYIEETVDLYADATGLLRDTLGALEKIYTGFDVLSTQLPNATNAVSQGLGGIGSLLSGFAGDFLGSYLGGRAGGAGVRGLMGRAGVGLRGAAGAALRFAGPVGAAVAGVSAVEGLQGMADNESWDARDWLGTTAAYAGIGAGVGSIIPGVGTAIGAVAGTIIGAGVGLFSSHQEQQRYEESQQQGSQIVPPRPNDYSIWEWNDMTLSEKQAAARGEGRSKGDWFVEADQTTKIHYGEMVIPAQIAQAVRDELQMGKVSPMASRKDRTPANVNINVMLQRGTDAEAMAFASRVKKIIENDDELVAVGMGRF